MNQKLKAAMFWIIGLMVSGSLLIYLGLAKGIDMAVAISRPMEAFSWSTSVETINACTYTPVFLGAALIVMGTIAFGVVFFDWYRREESEEKE